MKQCKELGCRNNVFSNGYCSFHQFKRTDEKWIRGLDKKAKKRASYINKGITTKSNRGYVIPKKSAKEFERINLFKKLKINIIQRHLDKKELMICPFCERPLIPKLFFMMSAAEIAPMIAGHHLLKREDKVYFLMENNIWMSHHHCHTGGFINGKYHKGFHELDRTNHKDLITQPYIPRMIEEIGKINKLSKNQFLYRLEKLGYKHEAGLKGNR